MPPLVHQRSVRLVQWMQIHACVGTVCTTNPHPLPSHPLPLPRSPRQWLLARQTASLQRTPTHVSSRCSKIGTLLRQVHLHASNNALHSAPFRLRRSLLSWLACRRQAMSLHRRQTPAARPVSRAASMIRYQWRLSTWVVLLPHMGAVLAVSLLHAHAAAMSPWHSLLQHAPMAL